MSEAVRGCEAGEQWTPELVEQRMLEAGRTLWRLPASGFSTEMRGFWPPVVRQFWELYGQHPPELRLGPPAPDAVTRMDEAWRWLGLIPDQRMHWRRVVALKAMNHPITCRPRFSNRRIAEFLNTSDVTVKSWHSSGLGVIAVALNEKTTLRTLHFRASLLA